ncbi:MAG: hypothetical protein MUC96_18950 [Myxococcaceae bacterium]|nr:hypothetical protein [Myxococcaceae bacterium]
MASIARAPRRPPSRTGSRTTARTSAATVENGLPYDGCSYPLTIDGVQYAPSADSMARVEAIAQVGRVNVTVTWRATGKQTTVACGWGSSQTLPEVQVVSIAPRAAP